MTGRDDQLLTDLVLSRATVNRAAERRADAAWLQSQRESAHAKFVMVSDGEVLMASPTEIAFVEDRPELSPTFLGLEGDGCAVFALHIPGQQRGSDPDYLWANVRTVGSQVSDRDAGIMVSAVALDNWQRAHRHCARCGSEVRAHEAGWAMRCDHCAYTHFPRTDPAVIVLVIDDDDRALLGRQARWEPHWFSTLAGFVEAGESAEAAVRREVFEESGVQIAEGPEAMRYLGSQPWPFPASLMLGYHARAADSRIRVDGSEIAEARWFSRAELEHAAASGRVSLPPQVSIARKLIERWFGRPIPGDWLRA